MTKRHRITSSGDAGDNERPRVPTRKELGEALRKLRGNRTQREVSAGAEIPAPNYSVYESGGSGMTVEVLFRILFSMDADIGDLAVAMGFAPSDEDLALTIREIRDAVEATMARRQRDESTGG